MREEETALGVSSGPQFNEKIRSIHRIIHYGDRYPPYARGKIYSTVTAVPWPTNHGKPLIPGDTNRNSSFPW